MNDLWPIHPNQARAMADAGHQGIPDAVTFTGRPLPSARFDGPAPEPRRVIFSTTPAGPNSYRDRMLDLIDRGVNKLARAAMERREEELKRRFQRELKQPAPLCMPDRDLRRAGDVLPWSLEDDPWDHSVVARVARKHLAEPPSPYGAQCFDLAPQFRERIKEAMRRHGAVLEEALAFTEYSADQELPVYYHPGIPPGSAWLLPATPPQPED